MKKNNFIFITVISLLLVFTCCIKAGVSAPDLNIQIVYPKNNSKIYAKSTFFIGSTNPGANLTINGKSVKVYPNGAFVEVFNLKVGINNVVIKTTLNNNSKQLVYTLKTPEKPKALPVSPLKIEKSSITPKSDLMYKPGETINITFKGSPQAKAFFKIGKSEFMKMQELPVKSAGIAGVYRGSYTVKQGDCFNNDKITVRLISKHSRLTEHAPGKITVLPGNTKIWGQIKDNPAVVRNKPNGDRLTPLPEGTIIAITGKSDNHYRFKLGGKKQVWTDVKSVTLLSKSVNIPSSELKQIDVVPVEDYEIIKIPMSTALPYEIKDENGIMIIDIYGAKANNININAKELSFITKIQTEQLTENILRLKINTNSNQLWGYTAAYCDKTLVLKLRKTPKIDPENPLKGQIIAIDPGHGGKELGSVGPTGIPEKTVNLAISKYLKQELEKAGAKVVMTRTTDNENPGLYERSEIARNNNALILLSIHNNALPDGKNPYIEHGTSTYYYHPQALELAKTIQTQLIKDLDLKDLGVMKGSFALTRPTAPVSILIEVAFMINPDEYAKLITSEFQKRSAVSIKDGLVEFLKKDYRNK